MQLEKEHMRSLMVRQYVVMDICIVILSFCEKIAQRDSLESEVKDLQNASQRIGSVRGMKEYLERLLGRAIDLRDKASGRRYSDIIVVWKKIF